MTDIFALALTAIKCCNFDQKKNLLSKIKVRLDSGSFATTGQVAVETIQDAGRPVLPVLVHPSQVPRRRLGSVAGRVGLIHAVAHIEFNAINLALDAVYRFRDMPMEYYRDWIRVAHEESIHFELLARRLHQLGSDYGALPAHGGLWEMSVATDYDVMVRMALVPRVLEARGLDVTPAMIEKLETHGDHQTVKIFGRILQEEIDHVRIGNRWYRYLCEQRKIEPVAMFRDLLRKHGRIALRGPFNTDARLQAGFTQDELDEIEMLVVEFKRDFTAEQSPA